MQIAMAKAKAGQGSKSNGTPEARSRAKPARTRAFATRPAHVEVTIDRALKRQWDEALRQISASKREGAGAFDELWETIGRIVEHEPPLYLAGGFASAKQFYKTHVGESERTAKRLIRVAKYASPAEEAKYGVSKLDAALGFIEATAGGEAKGRLPVDFAKLRIPVKRDGEAARVSLEDASVEDVRAAARGVRGAGGGGKGARESPALKALRAALREVGADSVKVQVVRDTVSLSGIPVASFARTLRALASAKIAGGGAAPQRPTRAKPSSARGS